MRNTQDHLAFFALADLEGSSSAFFFMVRMIVLAELLPLLLRLITAAHRCFQVSCFKFETSDSSDTVIQVDWLKNASFLSSPEEEALQMVQGVISTGVGHYCLPLFAAFVFRSCLFLFTHSHFKAPCCCRHIFIIFERVCAHYALMSL